jgi:hypothetical protein
MAKQFVVQLKNEPGAMATLAEALAAGSVDLRAIGGGSMGDSGHVIMTTADDDAANVNIYGHLFLGRWGDRATFTFVVDDPETARPILERKD